jgi:hypothetical protein
MSRAGKNTLVVLIVISRSSIITITKQGYYNRMQRNKRYPFSTPDPDLLSGKKAQTIQPVVHQNIHDPKHGPMLKSLLVAFFGVSAYHRRVWCASSPSVSLMGSFHPKAFEKFLRKNRKHFEMLCQHFDNITSFCRSLFWLSQLMPPANPEKCERGHHPMQQPTLTMTRAELFHNAVSSYCTMLTQGKFYVVLPQSIRLHHSGEFQ